MTDHLRGEREAMKKTTKPTKTRRSMTVVLTAHALTEVSGGTEVIHAEGISGSGLLSGVTVNALNSYLD
jgi:hypothetical protein